MQNADERFRLWRAARAPEANAASASERSSRSARASGALRWAWEWGKSIMVALVLFLVVRTFLVEAFKIPTASMENTLLVGDFLLVNKAVYGAEVPGTDVRLPAFTEPERGDVVVFTPPHEPGKNYVKRVIGLPGDTLEMDAKRLRLNGRSLREPYARHLDRSGDAVHPDMRWQSNHLIAGPSRDYHPTRDTWGPIVVPTDQYFVLGDNRDNSEDSRYWGFVPRESIRGRPWFVYYSMRADRSGGKGLLPAVRWSRVGRPVR